MVRLKPSFRESPAIYNRKIIRHTTAIDGSRLPALDGLRGIAILLVMLYHFTLYGGMHPSTVIDKFFYNAALTGWVGVDLFFVLSGFLITGILYDTKKSTHFFRNFYLRRFVRIFPLYYGTLVIFFVILPRIAPLNRELQSLVQQQGWYWSYLVNVMVALKYWSPNGIIEHFWTLAIEEQFYFFWPIVVFLLNRQKLMIVCIASIITSILFRAALIFSGHSAAASVLTPARLDSLAVGAFLALAARGPNGLSSLSRWAWPMVGFTIFTLSVIFIRQNGLDGEDILVQKYGYTMLAFLFGGILTLALTRPPETMLSKAFTLPGLQFFGSYSYALYVFHHPIVFYLKDHALSVATLPRIMGLQLPGQIFFIVIATGLSLAAALLSWRFYEQPFLKLKRLFPYQSLPKTAARPSLN